MSVPIKIPDILLILQIDQDNNAGKLGSYSDKESLGVINSCINLIGGVNQMLTIKKGRMPFGKAPFFKK